MEVLFWGVRGAIPCPGEETVRYGGNTACIELNLGEGSRPVVIDAGTGIRRLGHDLMARRDRGAALAVDIFLTHTHLDHIIGFPFFAPLYLPGAQIRIFGPATGGDPSLQRILEGQMSYHYFPVRLSEVAADVSYRELAEGTIALDDGTSVTVRYLNHPLLCLAYRFERQGRAVCTAFDTEPYRNLFAQAAGERPEEEALSGEGEWAAAQGNGRLEALYGGADLLIHDAQYTAAEYETSYRGWGHTALEEAIATATRAEVKNVVLFHHDPERGDAQLDALEKRYGRPRSKAGPGIRFAREGMRIRV